MEAFILTTAIFMHLSKKSSIVVSLYMVQSLAVSVFLFGAAASGVSIILGLVACFMFVIKVIVAPYFFRKLIERHQLIFSASTYLSEPLTLVALAALAAFPHSQLFRPLAILSKENADALFLAVASMLISIFLIINRKGILSQMIGVLSLENSLVSFAFLAGLEETPALQLGIIFDISIWLVIATIFASMIYEKFGSFDVTTLMRNLKED
ncbi:MAG TPA: hypothetical protein VMV71_00690 [Candidatus Paceibacterota bacterium]|nr:hypothetical protein [Candidatus Paceibacterota bacterium]